MYTFRREYKFSFELAISPILTKTVVLYRLTHSFSICALSKCKIKDETYLAYILLDFCSNYYIILVTSHQQKVSLDRIELLVLIICGLSLSTTEEALSKDVNKELNENMIKLLLMCYALCVLHYNYRTNETRSYYKCHK